MELTEKQKQRLRDQLSKNLKSPPIENMAQEFIECYVLSDEAIKAYYEHIAFQTGLSHEEIVGKE